MALPTITVTARLAADPELRYAQSGTPVVSLQLVSNARRLNKDTQQWEDGDTWWGRAVAFKGLAEAAAELSKGDLVTVTGRIKTDQWEDKTSGQKRSADQVVVEEIGRTLTAARQGGQSQQQPAAQGFGGGFVSDADSPPF